MDFLPLILFGLLGFLVTFVIIPLLIRAHAAGASARAADLHHTHRTPVSRFGGVALALAFVITEVFIAVFFPERRAAVPGRNTVILSSLAMFVLGWMDDLKPLGAKKKLIGQLLIAGAVAWAGLGIQRFKIPFTSEVINLGGWGVVVTIVWLVGMTNLINLIDGVDGLAGGICLMLMILLVYVGHANGSFELLASGMAGALLAFLYFNFPPARIFMGDGGAYFLGFQIGLFSLVSSQKGTIFAALVAPLFVLALPILDATLAILRRGIRGLPVFRPDRRHLHHHMLDMGLSRRRVVLSFYAVTLIFLVMGFAAFWSRGHLVPLLLGVAGLVLLLCAGGLRFSRQWLSIGRTLETSLAMRQRIQYSLSLTRWLALEGERCGSVEELWSFLVFAGKRLGFCFIRLKLRDGERIWDETGGSTALRAVEFSVQEGLCGSLEVKAFACDESDPAKRGVCPNHERCRTAACPPAADGRTFPIVAELLAEGWMKAASSWSDSETNPLRFDSPSPRAREEKQDHSAADSPKGTAPSDATPPGAVGRTGLSSRG